MLVSLNNSVNSCLGSSCDTHAVFLRAAMILDMRVGLGMEWNGMEQSCNWDSKERGVLNTLRSRGARRRLSNAPGTSV